ncbi:MAG TPA: hypothetical protein VLC28_08335 [Flavitalea sp.]|nr:hypothetical protein [Flavitalea sp.]
MKKILFPLFTLLIALCGKPVIAQTGSDTAALGLPGDNLDLYGVLTLFQSSKTIESFEKALNEQKTGLNNLDLDLDGKVDFIKVITKQKDSAFQFILQVPVTKTENQDVAVILVNKVKGKVSLQIVGDEALYGKDYVIEPSPTGTPSVTANPAYKGSDPIIVNVPATETIVVQSAPIVQYVYSPAYVPYYPPYYYGYYPPYFAAFTVMAVGIYRHNNWYHHGGYYGGHYHGGHNTVIINDRNNFNNYNNNKMRSNTVADNKARGNYDRGNGAGGRGSASTRPTAGTSNRPGGGASASQRPSNSGFNRPSTTPSTNQFNKSSNRSSTGSNFSSRPSTSNYSSGGGRTRSSGGFSGGGGGGRAGGGGRRR